MDTRTDQSSHDVIVIGAGFAGLTAARELSQRGLTVALLEARDRIGGRTFYRQVLGRKVEVGGTCVHWTQPYVWAEMGRYGLSPIPLPAVAMAYWTAAGHRHRDTPEAMLKVIDQANERLLEPTREVFPQPWNPLSAPQLADSDHRTLSEAIDELRLDEATDSLLRSFWTLNFNGRITDTALSQAYRWAATSSGSWKLMFEACASLKIDGGTAGLANAILHDAPVDLHLNTPVASVHQDSVAALVTTRDGDRFTASQVIVAVPLPVLSDIVFDPPLSPGKQAATEAGHAGRGTKVVVKVEGRQEEFLAMGTADMPFTFIQTEFIDEDTTTIACFGPDATMVDAADLAAVQIAVDRIRPGLHVVEADAHDWVADEFSKATWALHKPGFLTGALAEMQRPEGRVHLAGADIANGWSGFIDGAIESGMTTAYRIAESLRQTTAEDRHRPTEANHPLELTP